MSDPKYKHIDRPAMRLIEELGEAIQAVCKGERFGWNNFHPDRPEDTNFCELQGEISDVNEAFEALKEKLK